MEGKNFSLSSKKKFIKSWDSVIDGIFHAVDFIRKTIHVPVSLLLPYNTILVPFTYYFIKMSGDRPTNRQKKLLKQYFFWASFSERFSSGVEGKIALDLKKMYSILKEKEPSYRGEEVKLNIDDDIKYRWFSAGNAFCKGILCIYSSFKPLSFDGESEVELGNAWLKRVNSKNYHHFFPKSYLTKKGDEYLNKRTIGSKPPSKYMKSFQRANKNLENTTKTHLIDDLDSFGVWDDDYDVFVEKRSKRILEEINKRLYPKL